MEYDPNPRAVAGHNEVEITEPQEGAQAMFCACEADEAWYGGAAGGGKTWGLVACGLSAFSVPMTGVIFRRTTKQLKGLVDETHELYKLAFQHPPARYVGGNDRIWYFSSGAKLELAHLQLEKNMIDWDGIPIDLLMFDELPHFTFNQYHYLRSRNRGLGYVRPFTRGTFNPNVDSWTTPIVYDWLDKKKEYANPEMAGVIKYYLTRDDNTRFYLYDPEELLEWWKNNNREAWDACRPYPRNSPLAGQDWHWKRPVPTSFTFIPASLDDNPILEQRNPGYRGTLMSGTLVERARKLHGNFLIREAAGNMFKREWCRDIENDLQFIKEEDVPWDTLTLCRGWDLAATEKTPSNNPSWTCGTLIGRCRKTGMFYVLDHKYFQHSFGRVRQMIVQTAKSDPKNTLVSIPQDPGQAAVGQKRDFTNLLAGYTFIITPEARSEATDDRSAKVSRFNPFSAMAYAKNVRIMEGDWNERFCGTLEAFPDGVIKDDADSTSRAFDGLMNNIPTDYGRMSGRVK